MKNAYTTVYVSRYLQTIRLTLSCFLIVGSFGASCPNVAAKLFRFRQGQSKIEIAAAERDEKSGLKTEKPLLVTTDDVPVFSSPKKAVTTPGISTNKSIIKEDDYVKLLSIDHSPADLKALGESIVKIRKQVTDHPQDAYLRFRLGTYLYMVGDLEGAASELTSAITLNPSSASARAQLGKVLELGGKHMEALQQFRRSVEIAPNSAEVHFLFGESLMHGGNVQEAVNEFRRSIALQAGADTLAALSEGPFATGDNRGALEASRQAVSLDPTLARAQVALTNALLKNGDKTAALRTARQSMLLSPNSPESHLALGRCLFANGDQATAVEEFKQAVVLDPLNPSARNDLGYALYGRGEIVPAVTEFRLALRLNPRFVEARNNLEVAIHRLYSGK